MADEAAFKPSKETKKVKLNPEDPSCSKYVVVGTRLDSKLEGELVDFLRENRDIFAWTLKDMPGIPRKYAEHKLHVRKDAKPVRSKRLQRN